MLITIRPTCTTSSSPPKAPPPTIPSSSGSTEDLDAPPSSELSTNMDPSSWMMPLELSLTTNGVGTKKPTSSTSNLQHKLDILIWMESLPHGPMIWLPNWTPKPSLNFLTPGRNIREEIPTSLDKAMAESTSLQSSTSTHASIKTPHHRKPEIHPERIRSRKWLHWSSRMWIPEWLRSLPNGSLQRSRFHFSRSIRVNLEQMQRTRSRSSRWLH